MQLWKAEGSTFDALAVPVVLMWKTGLAGYPALDPLPITELSNYPAAFFLWGLPQLLSKVLAGAGSRATASTATTVAGWELELLVISLLSTDQSLD